MNHGIILLGVLALVLAEQFCLWWRIQRRPDWDDVASNLHSGHMVAWVSRALEIYAYGWVVVHASTGWAAHWPPVVQWLFAFILWDFLFWCMHAASHRIPLLWSVHKVHHQGRRFDLSLGVRNGWYSSLTNLPFMLPLAFIGIPLPVFMVVSAILYAHQLFNHCALVDTLGRLDQFLVTPKNHRVHHHLDRRALNRNFGGTLLLWDKLFNTYQPELPDMAREYGLSEGHAPANPILSNHGLLSRSFVPRRPRSGGIYVGIGGVLLFCFVAYGAWRFPAMPDPVLSIAITAGAITLGAVSDGTRWAGLGWAFLTLLAYPAWILGNTDDLPGRLLMAALAVHGALFLGVKDQDGEPAGDVPTER